jgi:hypothetical protein
MPQNKVKTCAHLVVETLLCVRVHSDEIGGGGGEGGQAHQRQEHQMGPHPV